jgi:hypothetical protein
LPLYIKEKKMKKNVSGKAVFAAMAVCALVLLGCPTEDDSKSSTTWENANGSGNTFTIYEDWTFKCVLPSIDTEVTGRLVKVTGQDNQYTLRDMSSLAAGFDGHVLTLVYSDNNTKLTVTCIAGTDADSINTVNNMMGGTYNKK